MKEITQTRVHYGYRRVHVMLRREGFGITTNAFIGFTGSKAGLFA